jgi:hypothetical protein
MIDELMTYQLPKEGQKIEVYRDALLGLEQRATDFSRSMGRISWIQGHILLLARKKCKKRNDWGAFLASINMKVGTAYLLRRVARDITAENKDMEYSQMLEIIFPDTYGKNRVDAKNEVFGRATKTKTVKTKSQTQTADRAYSSLASVKNSIQRITVRAFVDSKLPPAKTKDKFAEAIGVIDICFEELRKFRAKLEEQEATLTIQLKKVA